MSAASRHDERSVSTARCFEDLQIQPALNRRRRVGSLRKLTPYHQPNSIDFSSNDYLGLAQSHQQHTNVERAYASLDPKSRMLGSTGSRLLTGDSDYATALEQRLARWHLRQAALLCNSGYDANLAVLSSLTMNSTVLMDELCHNSLVMGIKLSKGCAVHTFQHSNLHQLSTRLKSLGCKQAAKPAIVVVESVYSMDGDKAPLKAILDLCLEENACVICDEAHGLGVFGKTGMGVLEERQLENHPALLCSIHTFGKAAGCHGAVICSSASIKEYLINYGRPIVYSTSLPVHSLVTISCSYESMTGAVGTMLRREVQKVVTLFQQEMQIVMNMMLNGKRRIAMTESRSPIQALLVPGNQECIAFCETLWNVSRHRIRLFPIRSPTVPKGEERVRIILHSHNTEKQVLLLVEMIQCTLQRMGYIQGGNKRHRSVSRL